MIFDLFVDDLVRQLNRREIDPSIAVEMLVTRVRDELGTRASSSMMSGLERYIDTACHRHFGGDCSDTSMQTFLVRQIKRLGKGRLAAPQEDGEIVWI